MSTTTAIEKTDKRPATLKQWLAAPEFKKQVEVVLPKVCTPDRFTRVALTTVMRTPKLAECTQESVFQCLLNCAQWGLEPDGRRAHLIPYGNICTLIVDYKGLVELAMRSGTVSSIHADIVCENDAFEYDRGQITTHKVDLRKPRGEMFAVYCIVRFKDGSEKSEVMSKEEVDAVRKRSRAGNSGPWVTDYNEMAKKTVFRRASKWIQLSSEFRDAMEAGDDDLNTGRAEVKAPSFLEREQVVDVTPTPETEGKPELELANG